MSTTASLPDLARSELRWREFAASAATPALPAWWLELLCAERLPGVRCALVLAPTEEVRSFAAVAQWRADEAADPARLADIAKQTLVEAKGVIQRYATAETPVDAGQRFRLVRIGYPVGSVGAIAAAVVLELDCGDEASLVDILRELHWSCVWLQVRDLDFRAGHAEAVAARSRQLLDLGATLLQEEDYTGVAFLVANELANRFNCSRVAIAGMSGARLRLAALSRSAWFERSAPIVKALEAAMDEVRLARRAVSWAEEAQPLAWPAVAALAELVPERPILVVPLARNGFYGTVLYLEREGEHPFSADELAWLEGFGGLCAGLIDAVRRADRSIPVHLRDSALRAWRKLVGPRHYTWKLVTVGLAVFLAVSTLVPVSFRVTARTVVEGEEQRIIAAPFQGYVLRAMARAGDRVHAGQVLAQFDDRDLRLEEARWTSEHDQAASKLREAVAKNELADTQVLAAQAAQAAAQLAMVRGRLAKAAVTAPFDGLLVSGDLSQSLGAPVEQGATLFEVAPLEGYRVVLKVDERDIGMVRAGQQGELRLKGMPSAALKMTVSRVTPVATTDDGQNVFRVEARLADHSAPLRPGLEGMGKIVTDPHSLLWIWTHRLTDWLRLKLWTYLP